MLDRSGMVTGWEIVFTSQARKDARRIAASKLQAKAEGLLRILANNPYQTLPTYEKLLGTSRVTYSRRINLQHRLVYEVMERDRTIRGHSHVDPLRIIGKL